MTLQLAYVHKIRIRFAHDYDSPVLCSTIKDTLKEDKPINLKYLCIIHVLNTRGQSLYRGLKGWISSVSITRR